MYQQHDSRNSNTPCADSSPICVNPTRVFATRRDWLLFRKHLVESCSHAIFHRFHPSVQHTRVFPTPSLARVSFIRTLRAVDRRKVNWAASSFSMNDKWVKPDFPRGIITSFPTHSLSRYWPRTLVLRCSF